MGSQSRVQLCGEIQIRLTPSILAPTPILTLNTTITLTTWLKAKDAADAKDKKIVQLEQELRELSNLNEIMLLVGVCMFSAFCLVLSVLPLPCLHDFCFFSPVSANAR
jgi:hypothetical protein